MLLYCQAPLADVAQSLGAPGHKGGARTAWTGAGLEPGPARLLEGGASAGNGAEHLLLGMGGVDSGRHHVSLFWALMVVFLCIFAFGASGFDSFLYLKRANFIFFT